MDANYVVIFAGGIGSRMGSDIPKQFLKVDGKPIIIHTIGVFDADPHITGIIVVCKEEFIHQCRRYIDENGIKKVMDVIPGGQTGQLSIHEGVKYLWDNTDKSRDSIVLVHDGVRPCIDRELIASSIRQVKESGNSIAVANAIETIIRINDDGTIKETIDRSVCRYAKAPQCFYLRDLYEAHTKAIQNRKYDYIDSAYLMSDFGHELHTVECDQDNIKITTPKDYYMFKALYEARKENGKQDIK